MKPQHPEFSRIIDVQDLSKGTVELDFAATNDECAALAARFALDGLNGLQGHARLKWLDTDTEVLVEATFTAEVAQTCSVSLEPVEERIEAAFSQIFSASGESAAWEGDVSEDGEPVEPPDVDEGEAEPDPPEPIIDGKFDIGECIAEELAVRINPAPRKKGVEFEGFNEADAANKGAKGPFAELARLKLGKDAKP